VIFGCKFSISLHVSNRIPYPDLLSSSSVVTNSRRSSLVTFCNKKWGFYTVYINTICQSLTICPLLRCYFGSWDAIQWPLLLWRGGCCIEVKIRVNIWTFGQDQKSAHYREVKNKSECMDCQLRQKEWPL